MSPNNSPAAEIVPTKASFRLKGGLFPLTLLELHHFDCDQLQRDLANKVAQAPGFFQQTPVIVSLEAFQGDSLPLPQLQQILRQHGMIVVALKGANAEIEAQAKQAGLGIMPANTLRPPKDTAALPQDSESETQKLSETLAPVEASPQQQQGVVSQTAKVISTPVRSGQQVYAPDGDLIVLAPVSAGAEILAHGNIHVYAPLRGRALAGVQGDETAQIFCQSLQAELISIAGQFKLVEHLKNEHWKQPVRISLLGQALCINHLGKS